MTQHTSLEAYIYQRYGRWVPFTDCTEEIGFDIEDAIEAHITKECTACVETRVSRGSKYEDSVQGGFLTPKLFPVKYVQRTNSHMYTNE